MARNNRADNIRPSITTLGVTVLSPNGGEVLAVGQTVDIQWQANGATSQRVQYSTDGGMTFVPIVTGLAGSVRDYPWQVPSSILPAGQSSIQAIVRVVVKNDSSGNTADDTSDGPFTVNAAAPTTVTVTAPSGGTYQGGQSLTVQWITSGPVSAHDVRLSQDGGNSFTTVTSQDLPGTAMSFTLTLPSPATSSVSAMVRVVAKDGTGSQVAKADSPPFTLQQVPASPPRIDSLSPTHGPVTLTTTVSVQGANFVKGCTVDFAGISSPRVVFVNSAMITADTPSGEMPGPANVRVVNPDGGSVKLVSAFIFDAPPVVREVSPPAGPAMQDPNNPQIVSVLGSGFQPGAVVNFGQVPSPSVTFVNQDGTRLDVQVPSSSTKGPVRVQVRNPDGQTGALPQGFTYLGAKQLPRARIFKVQPLTALENTLSRITVTGRNLAQAFTSGTFAVRGPTSDVAQITISNPSATSDAQRQVDTIAFDLRVKVLQSGGLGIGERLPLQIVASVRPHADQDLLTEASTGMLTVVSSTLPVPLGFSTQLASGGPNVVVLAGRNLGQVELRVLNGNTPMDFSYQQADDQKVFGILPLPTNASGQFALHVFDKSQNKEIDVYQLTLASEPDPVPGDMSDGNTPFTMAPVTGQNLVGSQAGQGQAISVKTGSPLPVGAPVLSSQYLDPSISVPLQLFSFGFDIPLVDEAILIPAFGRSGNPLADVPGQAKQGRFVNVTGLSVLLVIRVSLSVRITVALIPTLDPFDDADIEEPFNDFSNDLPLPYSNSPGAIFYSIDISVSVSIRITYYLALLLPGGGYRLIASNGITATPTGSSLMFDDGLEVQASILGVRPLGGVAGILQFLPTPKPLSDTFGYRGIFFALAQGRACIPWQFDLSLTSGFLGDPAPTPQPITYTPYLCLKVNANDALRILKISPSPVLLPAPGNTQVVQAIVQPVDRNGNNTGPAVTLSPDQVTFEPDAASTTIFKVMRDPPMTGDWKVTGSAPGNAVLKALVPTSGGTGLGVFPGSVVGFELEPFLDAGQPPQVIAATAPVQVQSTTMTVVLEPVLDSLARAEPFEAAPTQSKPLSLKISQPSSAGAVTVSITAAKPTTIPNPLQARFQSLPMTTSFDSLFELNLPSPLKVNLDSSKPGTTHVDGFAVVAKYQEAAGVKVPPGELPPVIPSGGGLWTPSGATAAPGPAAFTTTITLKSETPGVLLKKTSTDPGAQSLDFTVTLPVAEPETYEEYYRVLADSRASLGTSAEITGFQTDFANMLSGFGTDPAGLQQAIPNWGMRLWDFAVNLVQTSKGGDRPLYLGRLQAIASLRKFCAANPAYTPSLTQDLITQFECYSRGIGQLSFAAAPPTAKRVLITGFDPFFLWATGRQSGNIGRMNQGNGSGLLALWLKGKTLAAGGMSAFVQSVIFPVRYLEFDQGLVEQTVQKVMSDVDLLITTSQGRAMYYDIERFAARRRGDQVLDNNYIYFPYQGDAYLPPNLASSPDEFIESTLPYAAIVTSADIKKRGPDAGGDNLVLNQAFMQANQPVRAKSMSGQIAAFIPTDPVPDATNKSIEGSGEGYLSNEVFYRTAAVRKRQKPGLPSGHVHLPILENTDNPALRTELLAGAQDIVEGLVSGLALVGAAQKVTLTATTGSPSAPTTITVTNSSTRTVTVAGVDIFNSPMSSSSFRIQNVKTGTLAPGASLDVCQVVFAAPAQGEFGGALLVRGSALEPLFRINLLGEGMAMPVPVIGGVSPGQGPVGTAVTITGSNLAQPTQVAFNGTAAAVTSATATAINTSVPKGATSGSITVTTSAGTARSPSPFTVTSPGPRPVPPPIKPPIGGSKKS